MRELDSAGAGRADSAAVLGTGSLTRAGTVPGAAAPTGAQFAIGLATLVLLAAAMPVLVVIGAEWTFTRQGLLLLLLVLALVQAFRGGADRADHGALAMYAGLVVVLTWLMGIPVSTGGLWSTGAGQCQDVHPVQGDVGDRYAVPAGVHADVGGAPR